MYPTDIKVFIDDIDITKWMFGTDTLDLTNVENTFRDIDITQWIKGPGMHQIKITCGGGVGRVEARVEIS